MLRKFLSLPLSSSSSTMRAFVQVKPWHSLQDDVHLRPAFRQEQLNPQGPLQPQQIIFKISDGPASTLVIIGENLPFFISHP